MLTALDLTPYAFALLASLAFFAGAIRGFTGFALSALFISGAVNLLPPIALIPICFILEATASLLMARGGLREADKTIAIGLALGGLIGWPLGLWLTIWLPVQTSALIVVVLILALAGLQLAKIRIKALATRTGLYLSGTAAGMASGLASIGGMVVALYVLSQERPANIMRATLVVYLMLGLITSAVTLLAFGVLDQTAFLRGLALAPFTAIGVLIGKSFFQPALAQHYKPICLWLLIALAAAAGLRLIV